jgi:aminopeptidase N
MPSGKPFERLPETVRPQHYVLSLVPDLKALVFDGDVAVRIEVVRQTNEIVLNAIDLEIKKASLQGSSAVEIPSSTHFSVEDETVTFNFAKPIPPGQYSLNMTFKGILNDKMNFVLTAE